MIELAAGGASVIVISQDLEEIFAISHKIAVLHEGRLSKAYPAAEMNPQNIGLLMGGIPIDKDSKTSRPKPKKTRKRVAS
jgi:simple sugar transport system ATP-binding protein